MTLTSSTSVSTVCFSFLDEQELRNRIAVLQDYRRHGIRSFEDAANYEKARKNKDWAPVKIPEMALMVPLSDRPNLRSRKDEVSETNSQAKLA